jgi:shikimate dehydrogenase
MIMTQPGDTPLAVSGTTRLYGIFGHPIAHSLSPLMQTFAFQSHGLDCLYVPFPVLPERLPQAIAGAVALGICGLNVTIPHKEAILCLLDEVSVEARFVGAVNTVVIDNGRTVGHNTDGIGFLQPLYDAEVALASTSVCVLGAGGAARAITMALLRAGCPLLTLVNRTYERGARLATALQERFPAAQIRCQAWSQAAQVARASSLVVNATAVGLHNDGTALLPETCFHAEQVVYDIVYRPFHTPLLQAAQRQGAKIIPGIEMLIGQGAEAFRMWTGLTFPVSAVRRIVQPALLATS